MELLNRIHGLEIISERESVKISGGMPPLNPMWIWKWFKASSEGSIETFEPEDEGFDGFGGGSFGGGGSGGSW